MIDALEKVQNPGLIATVDSFTNLDSLLMYNRKEYFTYDGSLTTPPCSEVVIWIEFKNSIPLSHAQVTVSFHTNLTLYISPCNQTP